MMRLQILDNHALMVERDRTLADALIELEEWKREPQRTKRSRLIMLHKDLTALQRELARRGLPAS